MTDQKFIIKPIGQFIKENKNICIKLKKEYKAGLKHLGLFSHAVVIYSTTASDSTSLEQVIVEIQSTDQGQGKVSLVGCYSLLIQQDIYDIKPYFPCEDRVKKSTCVNKIWKSVAKVFQYRIEPIGVIKKHQGKCILKFNDQQLPLEFASCSHIKVFWWFDKFDKSIYRTTLQCNPPYENAPRTGVFASRSPVRPNPIAITVAKISHIKANQIWVNALDCFDQSPLIGVVPYYASEDVIDNPRVPEWLSHWPCYLDEREEGLNGDITIISSPLEYNQQSVNKSFDFNYAPSCKNKHALTVKGARQHNLKEINVTIPYQKITAITGVSGSGKSSLVFDTIYKECRRRFLDLSQQEIKFDKPEFDQLTGALPVVAISQKSIQRNPRSTVGTVTNIMGILRKLYASIGVRHCVSCGHAVIPMSKDHIRSYLDSFDQVDITDVFGNRSLNIEEALKIGNGVFYASIDHGAPICFQTHHSCGHCKKIMFQLTPSTFSYTDPDSICSVCRGYGETLTISQNKIITKPLQSLLDGASPWLGKLRSFLSKPNRNWAKGEVIALADEMGVDLEQPWCDLPHLFKQQVLYGSGDREVELIYKKGDIGTMKRPVEGIIHRIQRLYNENEMSTSIKKFMVPVRCSFCNGERLNKEGRSVTINQSRFPELTSMTLRELLHWCEKIPNQLNSYDRDRALPLLSLLYHHLKSCIRLGLDYLTLNRSIVSLSGGELQRLKLVAQVENDMSGVLCILDEPTRGLHPKDNIQLIDIIEKLKQNGNTIILVEHNRDLINIADNIIEIGPAAGGNGGFIIANGSKQEILENSDSSIGTYLLNREPHHVNATNQLHTTFVEIQGANYNNLKKIDISFPKQRITCITGVSGSGKTSLMKEVIYPSMKEATPIHCQHIQHGFFEAVVMADQSPIGKNPRSTPATFIGAMDEIRALFASNSHLSVSHFSFNSPLGQCDHCNGNGIIKAAFLDDMWSTCPSCLGKRYKSFVLSETFLEKNISDILEMTMEDAFYFFQGMIALEKLLKPLVDVGLGYIKLGQSAMTLSGGEAQRLKLGKSLVSLSNNETLYILDEPTAGLHFLDTEKLIKLLRMLVDKGHTVLIVEHNMDVIKLADWIIDLGPGGGDRGGEVIAQGTPQQLKNIKTSHTGRFL